jgi:membrane protein
MVSFVRAWLRRLVEVGAIERGVALGSYAFTALVPLLTVYGALAGKKGGNGFADRISRRFELTGSAATSLHQAFAPPHAIAEGVTLLSALLLAASGLTLTRGLQRLYQSAYDLPSLGVRGTPWGALWLLLIPLYLETRSLVAMLVHGLLGIVVSVAIAAAGWTLTPYVLLGRRLSWRVLLPGGIVTGVAMSVLAVASIIYLPHSVGASASQYGVIGVAFAILGWLIAGGFVLVGSAVAGGLLVRRAR